MALTDGLVSYWPLNETSGTREDVHGANDLTDNNTVLYGAGILNNAADHELDNSEYLEKTSGYSSGLAPASSDYSVSLWIKPETVPGAYNGRGLCGTGVNWQLWYQHDGVYQFRLQRQTTGGGVSHTVNYTLSAGTMYHVVIVWDHDDHTLEVYVNAASQGTDTSGSAVAQVTWNDPFRIGRNEYAYWDGLIDEVGFWSRKLSSAEVTALYNSGAGLAYPFSTSAPIPVFMNQYRQRRAA